VWNSVALNPTARSRGNFMFARQAMTLLEWSSRLACSDTSGLALPRFSAELCLEDVRYFAPLPKPCANVSGFELPFVGPNPQSQLLWALFDLIRHGQAHQYQQIIVDLKDSQHFTVGLTGPGYQQTLGSVPVSQDNHLCIRKESGGDLSLVVRPDVLFENVKAAVERSGLLGAGLSFPHLTRPATRSPKKNSPNSSQFYDFSSMDLEVWLKRGGLVSC